MAVLAKKVTARQAAALAALLIHPCVADAAEASGLGERTLYRYLQDPQFVACYRRARHRQVEQAVSVMQAAASKAVNVLISIATNPQAKTGARVMAARAVIDGALKETELETLEQRLAELERKIAA